MEGCFLSTLRINNNENRYITLSFEANTLSSLLMPSLHGLVRHRLAFFQLWRTLLFGRRAFHCPVISFEHAVLNVNLWALEPLPCVDHPPDCHPQHGSAVHETSPVHQIGPKNRQFMGTSFGS